MNKTIIFLSFLLLNTPLWAAENNPASARTPLSLEAKKIKKHIDRIEKITEQLRQLKEQIKPEPPPPLPASPQRHFAIFIKNCFQNMVGYLGSFGLTLKNGIFAFQDAAPALAAFSMKAKSTWSKWFLWKLLGAIACGFLGFWLTFRALRHALHPLIFSEKTKPLGLQLILFAALLVLPLFVFSFLQILIFFVSEPRPALRSFFVSLTVGTLILSTPWRLGRLIQEYTALLSPQARPSASSNFLFSQSLFWIKGIVLAYVLGGWALDLSYVLCIPEGSNHLILSLSRLGIVASLFFLLRIFRLLIIRWIYQNPLFPYLKSIAYLWPVFSSTIVIMGGLCWIFEPGLLERIIGPTLLTFSILCVLPFIHYGIRKGRILYLLKMHQEAKTSFLSYQLRIGKTWFHRTSRWTVYGLGLYYITTLWNFHILSWVQNLLGAKVFDLALDLVMLCGSAYVFVFLGDKVLKHYLVEKKALTDSIEALQLEGRWTTLIKVARIILRIVIWVPTFFFVLSSARVDIVPLLTSLGFITAGLTFGAQSLVKDFVTGFFIILENSLIVGDMVDIDGKRGIVEDLSLRTLKIRIDSDGTLFTIPFGSIGVIGNRSRYFSYTLLSISVPYDQNPDLISDLIKRAVRTLKKDPVFFRKILDPLEIRGVGDVTPYSLIFQARLKTAPGQQEIVRRGFNRVFKALLDEKNIKIPAVPLMAGQKQSSITSTVL